MTNQQAWQIREEARFGDARATTITTLRKLPSLDASRTALRVQPAPCRCPQYVIEATGDELRKICARHGLPVGGSCRCPCDQSYVTITDDTITTEPVRHHVDDNPEHHRVIDSWLAKVDPWLRTFNEDQRERQLDRLVASCLTFIEEQAERLGNFYRDFTRSQAWLTLSPSARWYYRAQHAMAQDLTWGGATIVFTHEVAREAIVAIGGPRYVSLNTLTLARVALDKAGAYESMNVGKSYKDGGGGSSFALPTAEHFCEETGCLQCRYPVLNKPLSAVDGGAYSVRQSLPGFSEEGRRLVHARITGLSAAKSDHKTAVRARLEAVEEPVTAVPSSVQAVAEEPIAVEAVRASDTMEVTQTWAQPENTAQRAEASTCSRCPTTWRATPGFSDTPLTDHIGHVCPAF